MLAGEVALPAGAVPEPFVDVEDIADVAVAALTEDGHAGEVYELTGPRALRFDEAVGRDRRRHRPPDRASRAIPVEAFTAGMLEAGVPTRRPRSSPACSPRCSTAATRARRTASSARSAAPRATSASTPARPPRRGCGHDPPGQTLENPVTGERFTFTHTAASTDGELLAFDFALRPGGKVPIPHVHPIQTERFEVVAGSVRFRLGLRTFVAGPGDVVEAPPGVAHGFANAGDGRGAHARRGPPRAGDGGDVRRGRRAGRGRADDPAASRATRSTSPRSPAATTRRRTRRCSASACSASCSPRSSGSHASGSSTVRRMCS